MAPGSQFGETGAVPASGQRTCWHRCHWGTKGLMQNPAGNLPALITLCLGPARACRGEGCSCSRCLSSASRSCPPLAWPGPLGCAPAPWSAVGSQTLPVRPLGKAVPWLTAPCPALGSTSGEGAPHSDAETNVGGLSFQRGIPCCSVTWGFPRDEASPVGHSLFPGSRVKRNWPCFAAKNGAQLKAPRVLSTHSTPGQCLEEGG